ncbi:MAG: nicotinate (nicotinamide) nucleotide adenylyltransferase [Chlorobium sp.]|nr:nicotinate (nicotinamide) nucleotide adenylyltransferase [Chlorobium sp.]
MHLAVFGATFDPPHNGHLALCLFARELLDIDRLIVSVSNNPFKQNRVAADAHRMRMAELLSREINLTGACSEVSGWELEKKQPSYTIDLLRYLHDHFPADKLTLLVGEDSFREFALWKEYEQLYLLCDIVVFARAATGQGAKPYEEMCRREGVRFINFDCRVSSTVIRDHVSAGCSISSLVPSSVLRYIHEHDLYRNTADPATLIQAQKHQES